MVQARTAGKPGGAAPRSAPASRPVALDRLRDHIARLLLEAASFVPLARVEATARGWLTRADPVFADPGREMLLVADALGMAMSLALFTPSASGATAFDRLARQRAGMGAVEMAALDALRRAQFRLLRVEAADEGIARMRDMVTGDVAPVLDDGIGAAAIGVALVGWLVPVGDGHHVLPAERRRSTRLAWQSPPVLSAPARAGCSIRCAVPKRFTAMSCAMGHWTFPA